jgi:DNA-binding CsgD family transcriptional regulator
MSVGEMFSEARSTSTSRPLPDWKPSFGLLDAASGSRLSDRLPTIRIHRDAPGREVFIVAPDAILGRQTELAAIARFFDHDPSGPRGLLLEGEAGIGKTTIWLEAVRLAGTSGPVFSSRASETEARLSFTVLTDLLEPALNGVENELPAPQRRALEAALLLEDPGAVGRLDARAVSLGALGVIRALAARDRVTLAIDDIQWADASSAHALSFALRRLVDEPVTVVAARRIAQGLVDPLDLSRSVSHLQRLAIGPIETDALGRLLRRLGRTFARPLVQRIHEASGGNPFFALEIGRALVREEVRLKPGEPLPVPEDLHALLRDRVAAFPAGVRDVLLIAAASSEPTVELVESMDASPLALETAVRADIVIVRGSAVAFTHPLLASTVYSDAAPSSLRDVHRRLADIATDPEERARHLALSSSGPNMEVAEALDQAALNARARGAPEAAAELCELAMAATPEKNVAVRQRRAESLAGNLFDAGDPPRAREILEGTIAQLDPGPLRAEALCLLSEFSWKDLPRVSELLQRALAEAGDEPRLRSRILSDLAWVGLDTCDLADAAERARAAVELAESVGDDAYGLRRSLSILALVDFLMGRPNQHLLDRAVRLQGTLAPADLSSPATCLGRQLTWGTELDAARTTLESELARYREQGHETARYEILAHLADVEYRAGRLERATQHLDEANDIAAEAGVDVLGEILPVRAAIECTTGDLRAARLDATQGLRVCERTGDRWNEIRCRSVLGQLELLREDPAAAHAWLEPLAGLTEAMGLREPAVFPFIPDAVEALVSLGELDEAKELTERLERQGAPGRSLTLGTAARCRGLIAAAVGDLPSAAIELEHSIQALQRTPQPIELAKSLLVAGEVQRRMKKKRSAREMLSHALTIFEEIGALLWAGKCGAELARIGGRAPSPRELTPTEKQVARLVADGRTNREVAEALFVSVHTVDANLKRIYRKLGVRSRTELANELGRRSDP